MAEELNEVARGSLWRNLTKWGAGNPQRMVAKPVAAVTAFRGLLFDASGRPILDPVQKLRINRQRNEQLKADLTRLGLGYYPVKGAGQEEKSILGFAWTTPTEEESFIVQPRAEMPEDGFVEIIRQLIERYEQDVAAVKVPSSRAAFLLKKDGTKEEPLGHTAGPRRSGEEYYSVKIKGPRASDSMLEPWELHGEKNPFRRWFNRMRGRSDLNQPRTERGGRRYAIRLEDLGG